jgi:large subunit ribosomal protein L25
MKKHTLQAQKREIVGRKVKHLRAGGMIPATVYGKKIPSETILVSLADFAKTFAEAGETGLVELTVDGKMSPVLIHAVQKHAVSRDILHIEFYHVDLKEKVHAKVPVSVVGEPSAVAEKKGALMTLLSEVEVEALPAELPEKIEVDVTALAEVGQEVKVSDLKIPSGVTLLTDGSIVVVKIDALVSKEAEEQAQQDAAAAAETAADNAAEAGATEEKAAEDKKEEAPKE